MVLLLNAFSVTSKSTIQPQRVTWTKAAKANAPCNPNLPAPSTPPTCTTTTMSFLTSMVIHDITGLIFSNQTGRFPIMSNRGHARTLSFSTSTMPTSLHQSQSRTTHNKNFSKPTKSPTSTCQVADSNLACIGWTTKPQRMPKTSSNPYKLLSNTMLWISIAPTPPNEPFALGRITSP